LKICFVPNYCYLNLPVFEIIIKKLDEMGASSYVLKLSGNTEISADAVFNMNYFSSRGIDFVEPALRSVQAYSANLISKIRLLSVPFVNNRIIRDFLKKAKPDVVVVGSDLGNLNIRFLLNACSHYKIPVVILYTCDVPLYDATKGSAREVVKRLKGIPFLKAILFQGCIPGSYFVDAKLCVLSSENKERLVDYGISENRINITGMPSKHFNRIRDKTLICRELGLDIQNDDKIVIFFTENIQTLHGVDYIKKLLSHISAIFKKLSNSIFFLVKTHPLESRDMESYIEKQFNHPRCKIIKNTNIEELIHIADLCIAHFSRVLITSALMRKRFLSINILNDRERTFIQQSESNILEIQLYEDLELKITRALQDTYFKEEIDQAVALVARRFSDLESVGKIATLICNAVKGLQK